MACSGHLRRPSLRALLEGALQRFAARDRPVAWELVPRGTNTEAHNAAAEARGVAARQGGDARAEACRVGNVGE
eukprot:15443771-Alexandrium_andersonii.AAC.1